MEPEHQHTDRDRYCAAPPPLWEGDPKVDPGAHEKGVPYDRRLANLAQRFGALRLRRLSAHRIYLEPPPNGSRLSCGRNARWRKAVEPQIKRLAGEATQFFRQQRPAASSAG